MNNNQRAMAAILLLCFVLVLYKIYSDSQQIAELQTPAPVAATTTVTPAEPPQQPRPQKPPQGEGVKAALSTESFFAKTNDGSINGPQLASLLRDYKISIGHFSGPRIKAWVEKSEKGALIYGKAEAKGPAGENFSIVIAKGITPAQLLQGLISKATKMKDLKEIKEAPETGAKLQDQKIFTYNVTGFNYFALIGAHPITKDAIFLALGQTTVEVDPEDLYKSLSFK